MNMIMPITQPSSRYRRSSFIRTIHLPVASMPNVRSLATNLNWVVHARRCKGHLNQCARIQFSCSSPLSV